MDIAIIVFGAASLLFLLLVALTRAIFVLSLFFSSVNSLVAGAFGVSIGFCIGIFALSFFVLMLCAIIVTVKTDTENSK